MGKNSVRMNNNGFWRLIEILIILIGIIFLIFSLGCDKIILVILIIIYVLLVHVLFSFPNFFKFDKIKVGWAKGGSP